MNMNKKYVTPRNVSIVIHPFSVRRSCAQVRKQWHASSSSSIQSTSKWEPSYFLDTELPKALDKSPNYSPCPSTSTKHRDSFLSFLSLTLPAQRIQAQHTIIHQSFSHPQSPFFVGGDPSNVIYTSFSFTKAFPPLTSSLFFSLVVKIFSLVVFFFFF